MIYIYKAILTLLLLLILTSTGQSTSKTFASMDNKLEVLQKDCEQYLKDPEISKKLKTMCDNVNASVGKVFNVGYQLVASVENATADEKKTDLYLDLLLKACDDRDTKGVNVLKIW